MASGKKNYFRHSFFAGKDDKIVNLITDHGKQAYFHYFRLLELCGEQASEGIPEKYVFHRRTLCAELMVTNSRLGHHLLAMQSSLLLEYVLSDRKVEILLPNLPKYLGRYQSKNPPNTPNKRKEKKKKEKKRKEKEFPISSFPTCGEKTLKGFALSEMLDMEQVGSAAVHGALSDVAPTTQEKWFEKYGGHDGFEKYRSKKLLFDEIYKAVEWAKENNRTVKGMGSFLSNWFSRSDGLKKVEECVEKEKKVKEFEAPGGLK